MSRGLNDTPKDLIPQQIDFLAGHPECGRFSTLSHSVTLGSGEYQATRGSDVSDIPMFIRMIGILRPRFFLMDDLPASFGPFPMEDYVRLLPDYDLFPEWVSNYGYGNIQKQRNRMFVVGALKSERFVFRPDEKTHQLSIQSMIADLIDSSGQGTVPNHATVDLERAPGRYVNLRFYGDRLKWKELQEIAAAELRGNVHYYSPEGERKVRPGTTNPRWDGPCPVLSGGYDPIHPIRRLPLTVRERARIQGFPDTFIFYSDPEGPYRKIWEPYDSDGQRGIKQTGKAMPLQFCTFVAGQVKAHIEGRPFQTEGGRILKPNPMVSQAKLDFCSTSGYADQEAACQACWLKDSCHIRNSKGLTCDSET
jgi:site-specific DNA-cytosine methylase